MTLFVIYCFNSSVILFRWKQSPHDFVLKHPQSVFFPESTWPSFTLNISNRWEFVKMQSNSADRGDFSTLRSDYQQLQLVCNSTLPQETWRLLRWHLSSLPPYITRGEIVQTRGQWAINRGKKEEEWMAATSMNAVNPSTMFIHTNPLPIIQSLLDRYNTLPASLYCSPFWKPWDLLTWLQQIPGYISDQWGQIMGWGEQTIEALSAFWPREWRISFPHG